MQTVTLRFLSLSELTTFYKMLNEKFLLDAGSLTISGSFPVPHVSIAQTLFHATVV